MDERRQPANLFHSWGTAKILYSDPTVTVKELTFATLGKTSLHYHMRRRETLYVQTGLFLIRIFNREDQVFNEVQLTPGMSYSLSRGAIHQLKCLTHGVIIETSLNYEEQDVVRIFDETTILNRPSMR